MTKFSFKAHLERQNIVISWQRYGIEALNFMALGLFSSLILGLIIKIWVHGLIYHGWLRLANKHKA